MKRAQPLLLALVSALAGLAGCSEPESVDASVTPPPPPRAPSASASTRVTATRAAPDAGRAAEAPSARADAGACGTEPLPDCPLQAWMKTHASPPVMDADLPALATALDEIAVTLAPPGYTSWASIAKDGAAAARSGDLPAAKASCRSCHAQYKERYLSELRTREI